MCLAIPAKITEILDEGHFAMVDVSGVRRKVNIDLLHEDIPDVNDWVLLHVGFAMSKISAEDAREQMQVLELLGESEQVAAEVEGYGHFED
ncbi:MAG: HypC/HybG/HupF family hydrogenase formation chaperone [Trueperaceae bacterium]|nr:HypC/HybG/HupF family hydrogenase formation chaperone [Trueperaceae bacterium]